MRNRLLAALPAGERARLEAALQPVALEPRQVLFLAGEPVDAVYFPVSGLVSAVAFADSDGHELGVEVAAIGRNGMVGVGPLLEANRLPFRASCQIAGRAHRPPLAAAGLRRAGR